MFFLPNTFNNLWFILQTSPILSPFPSIPSLPARISLLRGSNLAKIRSSRGETLDESSTTSLGKCNSQSVPDISTYICTIYSVHAGSDSVCTINYVLEQIKFALYMLQQKQVFEASALTRSLKGHALVFEPAAPLNKIVNLCLQICLIDWLLKIPALPLAPLSHKSVWWCTSASSSPDRHHDGHHWWGNEEYCYFKEKLFLPLGGWTSWVWRNNFYLLVVRRVEFEEIIFTSWWLDELSLKK